VSISRDPLDTLNDVTRRQQERRQQEEEQAKHARQKVALEKRLTDVMKRVVEVSTPVIDERKKTKGQLRWFLELEWRAGAGAPYNIAPDDDPRWLEYADALLALGRQLKVEGLDTRLDEVLLDYVPPNMEDEKGREASRAGVALLKIVCGASREDLARLLAVRKRDDTYEVFPRSEFTYWLGGAIRRLLDAQDGVRESPPAERVEGLKRADIGRTADTKADTSKNKRVREVPENPGVLKLAKRINDPRNRGRSKTELARELTDYNETKAQSLLRKLRDYPHLLA